MKTLCDGVISINVQIKKRIDNLLVDSMRPYKLDVKIKM